MFQNKRFFLPMLVIFLMPAGLLAAPSFARVASLQGDVLILRPGSSEWEYAGVNDLIEEGTLLRTEENSFAKMEEERGITFFLDENTQVEVETIDKDKRAREIDVVLMIQEGRVVGKVPKKRGWDLYLSLKGPVSEVILPEKAICEVRTYRSGAVLVKNVKGTVQLRTPEKITYLSKEEMAQVDPEGTISFRSSFSFSLEDAFFEWCSLESEPPPPPRYIPVEVEIGYYDLEGYGDWIYAPGYGYVWRPYVHPGWRPYYYGHWSFTISFGWVWVPYEPWGWVPFHYGRWAWMPGYGWIWIPGPVWGPGWVFWTWGPDWVGWCPMGPWGRPVYGVGFSFWTIVEINSFTAPRYRYKPPRKPGPDPYYRYKKPRDYNKPEWKTSQPPLAPKGIKVSLEREGAKLGRSPGRDPKRKETRKLSLPVKPPKKNKEEKLSLKEEGRSPKREKKRQRRYEDDSRPGSRLSARVYEPQRERQSSRSRERIRSQERRVSKSPKVSKEPRSIETRKSHRGSFLGSLLKAISGRKSKGTRGKDMRRATRSSSGGKKSSRSRKNSRSLDIVKRFLK